MGVILAFAMRAGAGMSPPQNHVDGWGIVSNNLSRFYPSQGMVDLGSCWPTVVGEEQVVGVILAFAMAAEAGTCSLGGSSDDVMA